MEELAQNFETVILSQANITDSFQPFYIKEVDQEKAAKIINKLNNSKAKDCFGLDIAVIKTHSSTLIKPITHLINLSIRVCKFPQTWKTAVIMPILKAGAPDQVSIYRPISILPVLSEILEKNCCRTTG